MSMFRQVFRWQPHHDRPHGPIRGDLAACDLTGRFLLPGLARLRTAGGHSVETLGLEGRASYYDRTGALKDVVQNHLLQVLCLVAMEPPLSLNQGDLANQKVDLLRSVRPLAPDQVKYHTRRGRYTAGLSAETGEALHRYIDEEGVDADRNSETYAEVMLEAGNWRWQGTRFRLRSGKALAARRKEVAVRFRAVPPLPFGEVGDELRPNQLVIGIDGPYGLSMDLTGMVSGPPHTWRRCLSTRL
jgi:glucose-6-phosphate 1-dehydrogenase